MQRSGDLMNFIIWSKILRNKHWFSQISCSLTAACYFLFSQFLYLWITGIGYADPAVKYASLGSTRGVHFYQPPKCTTFRAQLNLGFDLANFRGESATYAPNKKRCYNRWFMSGRLLVLKKLKTHFILSPTMSKHCSQKLRPYNHRSKNGHNHSATYDKALHTESTASCNPWSTRMYVCSLFRKREYCAFFEITITISWR